jgi:isopentenyl-diphosphate delta-isomerase
MPTPPRLFNSRARVIKLNALHRSRKVAGFSHKVMRQGNKIWAMGSRQGAGELNALSLRSTDEEPLVLVDAHDVPQGVAPKDEVHRRGLKHRAISVLVRSPAAEMLVHRRNAAKYHSGGLWTNACCSHPRPGEAAENAARRRLAEEMGIRCAVTPLFTAHYRAAVSNGYIEDEVVHVFGSTYEGPISPDPAEVSEWKWLPLAELADDLAQRPDRYTVWFRHYFREHNDDIAAWMGAG